ncbi:hypothetical protein [Chitinolyticbacter meiyuanensis]|uniref:hypothetical protein n=1 Tax=Chitinolyticbacter meiyuanensis TaxID=682798 RepID=UPI0011E5B568|nr:hypothetical protein [Chitinolyticbacter meiyuanensis]
MAQSLQEKLVEVRRAYRLLADYQQRLVELLEYIRKQLGFTQYHHIFNSGNTGVPSPYRLAQSSEGGVWALPLLSSQLFWIKHKGQDDPIHLQQAGDWMICAILRSDAHGDKRIPWLDTTERTTPEESVSEISFCFYRCDESPLEKPTGLLVFTNPMIGRPLVRSVRRINPAVFACMLTASIWPI